MSDWKSRAIAKRQAQYESIPVAWRLKDVPDFRSNPTLNALDYIEGSEYLSPTEHAITSITDGKILQSKLLSGETTAVAVATAFCKRAAVAQQLTGCCTEMFFEKALARAKYLDDEYARTGKPVGPLHGFPVSFKDNFDVEGEDSTIGWIGKIGKPAKRNSMGVELLLRLGAVIYTKTNIPQSLMVGSPHVVDEHSLWSISSCQFHFRTSKSFQKRILQQLAPPVAYAAALSVCRNKLHNAAGFVGINRQWQMIDSSKTMSDSYNHVFKQSVNALNRSLISGGSSGGEGALVGAHGSILGLGTDIGGSVRIPAALQGLYGMSPSVGRVPNDPSGRNQQYIVPPVSGPITSTLSTMELYFESLLDSEPWNIDPGLLPIPWRRHMAEMPTRSLKLGFIFDDGITKCQPPIERLARGMAARLMAAGHEVFEWDASSHLDCYDMWLSAVTADGGQSCRDSCAIANEPLVQGMLVGKETDLLSQAQRQQLEERKTKYKRFYLKKWQESGIDALIMPVTPYVGFPPKIWVKSKTCVSYTSQWNFLDYASLTIPAGKVDEKLDQEDQAWRNRVPRNEADDFNKRQYDVELVKGMPVGLQIVGGRFGEEKAVAVAKVILSLDNTLSS